MFNTFHLHLKYLLFQNYINLDFLIFINLRVEDKVFIQINKVNYILNRFKFITSLLIL